MNVATSPDMTNDRSDWLLDQVRQALDLKRPLAILGGGSKAFLGRPVEGQVLDVSGHSGIVHYDPTELVITARAGTSLEALSVALAEQGQMLPFEPPQFGGRATLGGAVAAGLSGPRRPWAGSARDFVLGTRVITGHGQHLRFGGEVMKNVAGYDVSRLLAGSFGCLGLLTEVSLKVLPVSRACLGLRLTMPAETALRKLAEWGQQPLPISAASHHEGALHLRLEGGEGSVHAAADRLGGTPLEADYWASLRERSLPFFRDARPLWRLSVPAHAPMLDLPGDLLIDWGGAQRWLLSDSDAEVIRARVKAVGGHTTCYSPDHAISPFEPLSPAMLRYHRQLKAQLDPSGIFNPGRLYAEL